MSAIRALAEKMGTTVEELAPYYVQYVWATGVRISLAGFDVRWQPPPSGWRCQMWHRVVWALKCAGFAVLVPWVLAWMAERGHLGWLRLTIKPGHILAKAACDIGAGKMVAFTGRFDGSGIPEVALV